MSPVSRRGPASRHNRRRIPSGGSVLTARATSLSRRRRSNRPESLRPRTGRARYWRAAHRTTLGHRRESRCRCGSRHDESQVTRNGRADPPTVRDPGRPRVSTGTPDQADERTRPAVPAPSNGAAERHLGPDMPQSRRTCSRMLGPADPLIDDAVPAPIRQSRPSVCRRSPMRARRSSSSDGSPKYQHCVVTSLIGLRVPRHRHTAGHPAQRRNENPRLVPPHTPVPAEISRAASRGAQLPDDGRRRPGSTSPTPSPARQRPPPRAMTLARRRSKVAGDTVLRRLECRPRRSRSSRPAEPLGIRWSPATRLRPRQPRGVQSCLLTEPVKP